jgi:hypothetical protein
VTLTAASLVTSGFGDNSSDGGQAVGSYFDVVNWGAVNTFVANLATSGDIFSIDHCTFTNSGAAISNKTVDGATYNISVCSWVSPPNTGNGYLMNNCAGGSGCGTRTTGVVNIDHVTVYDPTYCQGLQPAGTIGVDIGMTVKENRFYCFANRSPAIFFYSPGFDGPIFSGTNWANNFAWIDIVSGDASATTHPPAGTTTRTYYYHTRHDACSATENAHFASFDGAMDTVMDGYIFDPTCGNGGSNLVQSTIGNTVPWSFRITNAIALPGANGEGNVLEDSTTSACLQTSGNYCPTITVDHTTLYSSFSGNEGGFCSVESGTGFATICTIKDNIGWRNVSNPTHAYNACFFCSASQPVNDGVAAGYNWNWNVTNPWQYSGTSVYVSGAPYARPPVDVGNADPQFVDSTRNFGTWCTSKGASSTTDCFNHMTYGNAAYDASYTVSDLIDYVRAGFRPQNSATATASSTGGQVGAVAYQASSGGTTTVKGVAAKGVLVQ